MLKIVCQWFLPLWLCVEQRVWALRGEYVHESNTRQHRPPKLLMSNGEKKEECDYVSAKEKDLYIAKYPTDH